MDIFSAIVIVVPLMVPVGMSFGIDPVHLGIIFLANLELGYLTPPIGMNLFLSSLRFKKSLFDIWKTVVPFLIIFIIWVLLITYVPAISLGITGN
jgi:TRAP-type C4-dicarboxylate transport system permease large subunit